MKFAAVCVSLLVATGTAYADPLNCNMSGYRAVPGLSATATPDLLTLVWDGDTGQEVRMRFANDARTPVIRELAVRQKTGQWKTVATNARPEYRLVAGFRRMTNQQMSPLRNLGVEITPEIIEKYKWDAFHDAPLYIPPTPPPGRGGGAGAAPAAPAGGRGGGDGEEGPAPAGGRGGVPAAGAPAAGGRGGAPAGGGGGNPPPAAGIAGQPGRPRNPNEIRRATATYGVTSCAVKTDGLHLVVSFPGVKLGMFAGSLQYTVYKGTNLIRQEVIARTTETTVAYKYDTGLTGLTVGADSRVAWRDTSNLWQTYSFGGKVNTSDVALQAANRTIAAEGGGASIAMFPPPHSFFWSRQTAANLGYNWYRKESETSFSLGIRQAEHDPDNPENFALYSARPNTDQRMPMYIYVSPTGAQATVQSALAFTHHDRFKALPGYQVMASHFHTSIPSRLAAAGSLDVKLPDFEAWKAVGYNIVGPVDGGRIQGDRLAGLKNFYEAARRHSDKDFLVMPTEESGGATRLGGHNDVLYAKPVYWDYQRPAGTPFMEQHPIYGKVYHVGDVPDMLELMKLENMIVYMPHPRSKGSTGWPDAMKDTPQFNSNNYRGVGMRWGMGVDGSETRLCEIRCQTLLDDMNNWVADRPIDLKYVSAIYDAYQNAPGDDLYANNPVNYIKLASVPTVDDMTPIIDAMKRGDYFWTSGEVLIPNWSIQGTGARRTVVADVEWTFPLAFVEVVWGDGVKTDRQVISATDLPAFGKKRFEIPFDVAGKKWVRFAAWDTATNGAMVMPVRLTPVPVP